MRKGGWWPGGCLCFYCGVDSRQLIALFLCTLGAAVLGAVLLFLWTVARGDWRRTEAPKHKVLEAEHGAS